MENVKYYYVTFEYCENVFCTNIACADIEEKVAKEYSKYSWVHIRDLNNGELEIAKQKGMPIIKIN